MIAVATSATSATTDGIDPAVLAPLACLLVGLALGYLLRWALERRTIRLLRLHLALHTRLLRLHTARHRGAIPTFTAPPTATQDSQP